MKELFDRIHRGLLKANLAMRKRAFQIYIRARRANLAGADLSFLDLSGADLSGGDLREANLIRADLADTNLTRALLQDADLSGAALHGADLTGAQLAGADVTSAQLTQASSIRGATLPDGSVYRDESGQPPTPSRRRLLKRADLAVDARPASLRGRDLREMPLQGADLQGYDLREADLRGVDLMDTDLSQADLRGANLKGALVTDEQLAASRSLKGATLPDGREHA